MKRALKIGLLTGVILALSALYWVQKAAEAKKKSDQIRRAAIAQNRALIAAQAAAMRDGPGRSLTGSDSTRSIPGWTKASSAFLATEARFANVPATPPPASNNPVDPASPLYSQDWPIAAAPTPANQ
jgi:Flp pilus assembly protein TadB